MMFKINIYLTTSKLAAYLILIIGTTFAFIYKDAATLLATFSAVSAILMMKTYTASRTEQTKINKSNEPPEQDPNI